MTTETGKFSGLQGVITSVDQIRATLGEPPPPILAKVIDHVDDICRDIIAESPFMVVASADSDGRPDISPKGDPEGFVLVLDDKHLAIPDRPGNRRVDTFRNLLDNPFLALLFIIPGKGETLRVKGEARIVRDEALRQRMAVNGRVPEFAVVVHIEQAMIHCPKCMVRAKLWQSETWPDHASTASIAEAMVVHADLDMTAEELHTKAEAAGVTRLY